MFVYLHLDGDQKSQLNSSLKAGTSDGLPPFGAAPQNQTRAWPNTLMSGSNPEFSGPGRMVLPTDPCTQRLLCAKSKMLPELSANWHQIFLKIHDKVQQRGSLLGVILNCIYFQVWCCQQTELPLWLTKLTFRFPSRAINQANKSRKGPAEQTVNMLQGFIAGHGLIPVPNQGAVKAITVQHLVI